MNSRDQQSFINSHMYETTSKHIHTYLIFLIITWKSRCTYSSYQLYLITFLLVSYKHTTHKYWNQKMKAWIIPWKIAFILVHFFLAKGSTITNFSRNTYTLFLPRTTLQIWIMYISLPHMIVHITRHDNCKGYNIAWIRTSITNNL